VVARGARKVIAPILRSASKIRHTKIDVFPAGDVLGGQSPAADTRDHADRPELPLVRTTAEANLEKFSQFRCRFELRDRIEFLERERERI
jgi:hypothetical protein